MEHQLAWVSPASHLSVCHPGQHTVNPPQWGPNFKDQQMPVFWRLFTHPALKKQPTQTQANCSKAKSDPHVSTRGATINRSLGPKNIQITQLQGGLPRQSRKIKAAHCARKVRHGHRTFSGAHSLSQVWRHGHRTSSGARSTANHPQPHTKARPDTRSSL